MTTKPLHVVVAQTEGLPKTRIGDDCHVSRLQRGRLRRKRQLRALESTPKTTFELARFDWAGTRDRQIIDHGRRHGDLEFGRRTGRIGNRAFDQRPTCGSCPILERGELHLRGANGSARIHPDASGEKTPTTQKNGGERNDQKQEGAKPDTGKPDSQLNGEKSPRPDAPGLQKLADTLREAEEAQKNASRDSKLADRLREQAMKTLENASPEQIEKAAEAARDLATRAPKPDSNSVSPDVAKKMLDQAEQLMKNATPEQKQKLQDLARKMAEGMPDNNNNNNNKDGGGDQQSQDATRRAAEEFMKNASPEDKKKLSDLAKSLGLDRPGNRGQGNQPGEGPGRERGDPREFGNAETKTIDMRDHTNRQTPSQNDRVISDWFDPTGKPSDRATSGRSATGAEVVRRAVQGAERSIEQQVVPPQQGEYVRRVFRRYLQRTQGATPTQSAPSSAPATPDAPDAPRK